MRTTLPLERILYPPDYPGKPAPENGDDIKAIKRVVSRAGFWPWGEFNKIYSDEFAHGVINKKTGKPFKGREGVAGFKGSMGLKSDGIWNENAHLKSQVIRVPKPKIHAGELAWDQFAYNLYKGYEWLTPAEEMLEDIYSWWDWMVGKEPSIYYSQTRPIPMIRAGTKPPKLPFWGDCSGTFIGAAWLAGAKSPDTRYGYSGAGNTDSLIQSGTRISVAQIPQYCKTKYIGAFYGDSSWDTDHIVAVKNATTMYSMGRDAGPEIIHNIHYHPKPLIAVVAYDVL